jgi:pyruvate dehydrogenase complex dehydrogenase (E1) component
MTYFLAVSVIVALLGLYVASAATATSFAIFGFALMLFGVFFALFLVKRHFDHADGIARR